MAERIRSLRICTNGHRYYKSSDCPVCPTCEKERASKDNFLDLLASPARRALENHGINSLDKLAALSEKDILAFHGMGKSSIPKLRVALAKNGLSFKK